MKYLKIIFIILFIGSVLLNILNYIPNKNKSNLKNIIKYNDSIHYYENLIKQRNKKIDSLKINVYNLDSLLKIKKHDTIKIIQKYEQKADNIHTLNDSLQLLLFTNNLR